MVPPDSHGIPRVPWYSGYRFGSYIVSLTGLSPSMDELSISFNYHMTILLMRSYNPRSTTKCNSTKVNFLYPFTFALLRSVVDRVWALPHSLVATKGISVDFFSSGYLDVSVHQVPFLTLCIQIRIYRHYPI